jgi:hypothetical protein
MWALRCGYSKVLGIAGMNGAHVDFAIVTFGLAVTVLEEDQESVALDMYLHLSEFFRVNPFENTARALGSASKEVRYRHVANWTKADPRLRRRRCEGS